MRQAAVAALALLLWPGLLVAQEDDSEEDWYRVELLILANRDPEAALSERWPLLPELSYPEQRQFLESEPLTVAGDRQFRLVTLEETLPPPLFDLMWDRSVEDLYREHREKQLLREPAFELETLVEFEVPRQRVLLPAGQREFNSQRRRIESSAGLEVLFHQAWLQRIDSREASRPLIIDGPALFGDYPELQGSILLYSGRYLHIATKLWLNTGGNYLDVDPTTAGWRMPRPPLTVTPEPGPAAETVFRLDISPDWLGPIAMLEPAQPALEDEAGLFDSPQTDELPEPVELPETDELPERYEASEDSGAIEALAVAEADTFEQFDDGEEAPDETDGPRHEPVSDEALAAFLAEPVQDYEFRHAVLLQQSRRMRSGELHYIDHPLVGIVVKVSRHEFEPFIAPENPDLASAR